MDVKSSELKSSVAKCGEFSLLHWAIADARERGEYISAQAEKACISLSRMGKRFAIDFGYENAIEQLLAIKELSHWIN